MIEKKLFFLTGFSSSGTQELSNLLLQDKNLFVSNNSPLPFLVEANINFWNNNPSVIANKNLNQLRNFVDAIKNGCWEHISAPIVIDNSPRWAVCFDIITEFFDKSPKIIVTIDEISSMISEHINQMKLNNTIHRIDKIILEKNLEISDKNRRELLYTNLIQPALSKFYEDYNKNKNCFCIIENKSLNNSAKVIDQIYNFLEIN